MPLVVRWTRKLISVLSHIDVSPMTISSTPSKPLIFRYGNRTRFHFALSIGASVFIFFGFIAHIRGQFTTTVFLYLWACLWWYLVWWTLFMLNNADVAIDDVGLCRVLFGRNCQRMNWSQIENVREYSLFSRADKKMLIFIQLIPKSPSFFEFRLCRKMILSEKVDRFNELISALNVHLSRFPAKIEVKTVSGWHTSERLSLSL